MKRIFSVTLTVNASIGLTQFGSDENECPRTTHIMAKDLMPSKQSMLLGLVWNDMTRRPFVYTENALPITLTVLGSVINNKKYWTMLKGDSEKILNIFKSEQRQPIRDFHTTKMDMIT